TSATCPLRTSALNSLYEMVRPPGVMKYAWAMASRNNPPRTHQSAVGLGTDGRLSFWPDGLGALGNHGTSGERQLIVCRVDHHVVAFAEVAFENAHGQWIEHAALDGPLERAGPVYGIIPFLHEQIPGRRGQLDGDLAILEPLQQALQLDVHDLRRLILRQPLEEDDLVDAVDELRPEVLPERVEAR